MKSPACDDTWQISSGVERDESDWSFPSSKSFGHGLDTASIVFWCTWDTFKRRVEERGCQACLGPKSGTIVTGSQWWPRQTPSSQESHLRFFVPILSSSSSHQVQELPTLASQARRHFGNTTRACRVMVVTIYQQQQQQHQRL